MIILYEMKWYFPYNCIGRLPTRLALLLKSLLVEVGGALLKYGHLP